MFKTYQIYIDTSTSGLVVQLDHNLNGMPFVFLSEPTLFGDIKYVSMYDPRIASIETKGSNSLIISFTSSFKGNVSLLLVTSSLVDFSQKLTDLDRRIKDVILQQKNLTSNNQFSQMISLLESEISRISSSIEEIKTELANVKNDISFN